MTSPGSTERIALLLGALLLLNGACSFRYDRWAIPCETDEHCLMGSFCDVDAGYCSEETPPGDDDDDTVGDDDDDDDTVDPLPDVRLIEGTLLTYLDFSPEWESQGYQDCLIEQEVVQNLDAPSPAGCEDCFPVFLVDMVYVGDDCPKDVFGSGFDTYDVAIGLQWDYAYYLSLDQPEWTPWIPGLMSEDFFEGNTGPIATETPEIQADSSLFLRWSWE